MENVPEPGMGANDMRIRVAAVGTSFSDTRQITSHYQIKLDPRSRPERKWLTPAGTHSSSAKLQAGETLLALGACVTASTSTEEKPAVCRKHGADDTINYADGHFQEAARALTEGRVANTIYDTVGGRYSPDCLSSLAWNRRWLIAGFAAGEIPQIVVNKAAIKRRSGSRRFLGQFRGART